MTASTLTGEGTLGPKQRPFEGVSATHVLCKHKLMGGWGPPNTAKKATLVDQTKYCWLPDSGELWLTIKSHNFLNRNPKTDLLATLQSADMPHNILLTLNATLDT